MARQYDAVGSGATPTHANPELPSDPSGATAPSRAACARLRAVRVAALEDRTTDAARHEHRQRHLADARDASQHVDRDPAPARAARRARAQARRHRSPAHAVPAHAQGRRDRSRAQGDRRGSRAAGARSGRRSHRSAHPGAVRDPDHRARSETRVASRQRSSTSPSAGRVGRAGVRCRAIRRGWPEAGADTGGAARRRRRCRPPSSAPSR